MSGHRRYLNVIVVMLGDGSRGDERVRVFENEGTDGRMRDDGHSVRESGDVMGRFAISTGIENRGEQEARSAEGISGNDGK